MTTKPDNEARPACHSDEWGVCRASYKFVGVFQRFRDVPPVRQKEQQIAVRNNREINRSLGNMPYLRLKKQEEVNILNLMLLLQCYRE